LNTSRKEDHNRK